MGSVLFSTLVSSGRFLASMIPIFFAGVVVAEVLVALGWIDRIAWITRPLTSLGHLKKECGTSFLTAFFSPAAGNAMLVRHHEAGLIDRRELLIAAMVNTFPGIVMHWRTMLPMALPLIGVWALVYYGFLVLVGFIKTMVALLVGRFVLKPINAHAPENGPVKIETQSMSWELVKGSINKSRGMLLRMIRTTVPVTLIMFLLIHAGAFERLNRGLAFLTAFVPLSPEALSIVATRLGSNIGAFTVAGSLLYSERIVGQDVVLALLIGNLLASGINLRYLVPYYFGIFGTGMGIQVLTVSTGLRMAIMLGLIGVLFKLWG
ncbi:nucleoside recognition protein [Desulfonema ishimotonii]|uniref:Nucleoside recognition protein n=1 Tax=Desulfonema ishimotonii TaxID=45657 RepID=A0A401G2K9_9BACT|nr:nucleoside recognition domain-containing protein [Desulfonema ishimotonii]GBC63479.1 nucleoside recognition protein [Desulfonema ishimotonii]